MHFLILSAWLSLTSSAAQAGIPDCWTVDGSPIGFNSEGTEIADGEWLVEVDFSLSSKDDLVWLLGALKKGVLHAPSYPIVFEPKFMVVHLHARDDGSLYPKPMPRDTLRVKADAQVSELFARNGVASLGCNSISRPSQK